MTLPHTPHGRETELHALGTLLETNTLITLVGPGGIGKTWLAKALLEAHRANGGRGWFCAAERARMNAELIEALETAVESQAPGLTDLETRFERVLTSLQAPGLLVIDNVEQLPDPARLIARLSGTGVTVLLTSRHQLHLDGEQIFPVKGLGAAASALFIRQARVVDPTFDATRPGFEALLESLDGVPLAIELAAGRMGSFTPEDILKRLDLGLADRVSRARPQRQSSIERSHAWSWDMCEPALQAALGRCTVFEDGFDLDAAEAVLGSDAIELIQAMVNRSLLRTERVHGRTRFDMRQLWREFVRQQTAPGLMTEAQTAHREWYLSACMQAALQAHGPDGQQARRWLMAERANLGMLATAGAWEPVWALRVLLHYGGLPAQFPHWVKQCDGPFAELMRGELALQRGRLSEATIHLERALDAVDDLHRWEVLLYLGIAAVESSGPDGSMKMHTAALEAAQAVGSHRGIGRALGSQGVTLNLLGDPSGARDRYDQAFDALQRAGDTLSLGILTLQIGDLHVQAGRLTEARLSFTSAHTQFRALASTRWLGFTAGRLGAIALENGQADVAIANCREAVEQLTRVGCLREAEVYRGYVGVARHAAGDLEGALSCYIDAQTRIRSDRHHCAVFASFAAVAAFQLGQSAEYWLKTTETLAEQIQRKDVLVTLALNRAHARARLDPAEANARLLETAGQSIGTDGRIARRWLAVALGQVDREIPDALHVSPDFERFEPPGKARIDIGKRRTLVRIFQALVVERRERPGSGLSLDALQSIGWPGERMSPISGANRVYVAIASLRASGLRDLLLKREVGYLLDPNVRLLIRADSPSVTDPD